MITTRSTPGARTGVCAPARHRSSPALLQLPMDVAGELAGDPGHGLELLAARADQALRRAEVLEQRALAHRPHAAAARRAASAVIALSRRCGGGRARSGAPRRGPAAAAAAPPSPAGSPAGSERPGTKTSSRRFASPITAVPRSASGAERPHPRRELALAAVDHDQVRQRGEALVALGVVRRAVGLLEQLRDAAARAPPPSRRSRPGPADAVAPDRGTAGSRTSSARRPRTPPSRRRCAPPPRFEMSKPSIRTGSESSAERLLQRRQRVHPLLAAALLAQLVLGEREPRVALRQLAQAPLVAALGDPHLDRPAAPRRRAPRRAGGAVRAARGPTTTSRGTAGDGRVVLGDELLGHLRPRRARPRWRGRSRGARRARRREPGRPGRSRPLPSTATAIRSALVERLARDAAALHQRAHRLQAVAVDAPPARTPRRSAASAILRSRSRSTSR